ncbi:MAG: cytidylyltransferase domain-containing protein, partial [Candidatus Binatia bacterium]
MSVVAIIPARFGSTRLPAKPLAQICGRPMIQHVYESAAKAKVLDRVIVATDDRRIEAAVKGFGGEVMMTSPDHASGTDRLAEVARKIK